MAAGIPSVAKVGGITEIISEGENGLLVDYPPDADKLSKIVVTLLSDEKLAGFLGTNVRHTALTKFSWDNTTIQFQPIYTLYTYIPIR